MNFPNGYCIDGLLVFGDSRMTHVSKGFIVEAPDLVHSSGAQLDRWRQAMQQMLIQIGEKNRAQVHWNVVCDFENDINRYAEINESPLADDTSRRFRDARVVHYSERQEQRQLRRQIARFYQSKVVESQPPVGFDHRKIKAFNQRLIEEYNNEFFHLENRLQGIIQGTGARIKAMGDEDHFAHVADYLNPSIRYSKAPLTLDVGRPLLAQTVRSGMQDGQAHRPPFGFFWDGFYHNFLICSKLPDSAYTGLITHLSNQDFSDYAIIQNIYPTSKRPLIKKLETDVGNLRRNFAENPSEAARLEIASLEERLQKLNLGNHIPADFDFSVHIKDRDINELIGKTAALQTAFREMRMADYYAPVLFETNRKIYLQGFPGFPWGGYNHHRKPATDEDLARLLPLTSSFTGHLERAQAIFEGQNNQPVGVAAWINDTPQSALVLGMPGAGKSYFMDNLLNQLYPYATFTAIIEEKLFYGRFTKSHGCRPVIIDPNGTVTINPFDTHGAPLDDSQIAAVSALCAIFAGETNVEREDKLQGQMLTSYIRRRYEDSFDEWQKSHSDQMPALMRRAALVWQQWQEYQKEDPDVDFVQAWVRVRDWERQDAAAVSVAEGALGDEQVTLFAKNASTERYVMAMAFSRFEHHEYPQLADLVDDMANFPMAEHDVKKVQELATLLRAWTADEGSHGCLFDGVTNINLTGRIAHFECGRIGKSGEDMKQAVNFLIGEFVRCHIITLPRSTKKIVVFEEASKILDSRGGEKLVEEFYAQFRAYGVWVVSVIQTYAQFARSRIRPVIMNCAKQFFILRMNSRSEVDDFCTEIELPEAAQDAVLNYPLPEHVGNAYSSVLYHHLDAVKPITGTFHVVKLPNEEMEAS